MAIRLRVRELAEKDGMTMGAFQRRTGVSMSTARRFWYSTSDGKVDGPPLKQVSLEVIEQIANFFDVEPGELFMRTQESSKAPPT